MVTSASLTSFKKKKKHGTFADPHLHDDCEHTCALEVAPI